MKYLSLFSGIGAFEKALEKLDIDYELVGFSEIDKFAIRSYCAIHNIDESLNLGDIKTINCYDKLIGTDLITHGSPCQDFSIAGLQAGGTINSGTRSSLMWETIRIIKNIKPKYIIWENVKNVLSKKHRPNFNMYLDSLDGLGYNNYYKVLNAKNYNIPQNRERIYTISIRKDIDTGYTFPIEKELTLKLKDLLEDDVDEKYYLNTKFFYNPVHKIIKNNINVIGHVDINGHDCIKRIYSKEGIAPTLTDMQGGHRQPKIAVAMRGRYNSKGNIEQKLEWSNREIANSITTVQKDSLIGELEQYKIRKLTPRECFRLMGFDDIDFDKAKSAGISDTQLYKQAGNSICVPVLEGIFKALFL